MRIRNYFRTKGLKILLNYLKFCLQLRNKSCIKLFVSETYAPVAQLDRASDYGSEGCEFESRRVRH